MAVNLDFRFLIFIFLRYVVSLENESEVIHTKSGPIQGLVTENSEKYLGIPYARAERFEPPVEHPNWSDTLRATRVGPMCYQSCPTSPPQLCLRQLSEDCLSLNIWVPRDKPVRSNFAVMVFIHGGNFVSYSGGSPLYDGDVFVMKGGVILVTLNYRLRALGFLGRVLEGKIVSANNGLLNQEMALEWIYNNIQAFGGDSITLFGQSAGAQSIMVHLTSPKASPHFQRAIIQSSPVTLPFRNIKEAQKQMQMFLHEIGCNAADVSCLKSKSSDAILKAQHALPQNGFSDIYLMQFEVWGPVVDGNYITGNLLDMMEKFSHDKDIIIGTVSGEGIAYAHGLFINTIPDFLFSFVVGIVIPGSSVVAKIYDVGDDARGALTEVTTDFVFYCPSRRFADILSKSKNVWFYLFDQPLSIDAWGNAQECVNQSCHGVELPFLFDTPYLVGHHVTADDEKLSSTMIGYWSNFAKYGTPNHGNALPSWPKYSELPGNPQNLIFTEPNVLVREVDRNTKCSSFEKQGYKLNG